VLDGLAGEGRLEGRVLDAGRHVLV
jgi:hypothetical protein